MTTRTFGGCCHPAQWTVGCLLPCCANRAISGLRRSTDRRCRLSPFYDSETRRLIGMGSRAIQRRFVAGVPSNIGYLSGLRLLPEYHGHAGILARGYRMFRQLHDDGRAPFYLTTIAASNSKAISLLTSGRSPLPTYCDAGLFHTIAIPPLAKANRRASVIVRTAQPDDAQSVIGFLHKHASQREFFPVYSVEDLLSGSGLLRGLCVDSVLLAERGGRVVGTLALWDQRSFKQSMVVSYPWWIGRTRPLYNAVARVRGAARLPAAGTPINSRFAALFAVADEELEVAAALVRDCRRMLHRQRGDMVLFGMHEADPLLQLLTPLKGRHYLTKLYLVHWGNRPPNCTEVWRTAPYLEVARL